MKKMYLIIIAMTVLVSCKKDYADNTPIISCSYDKYSTPEYDRVHQHLVSPSPFSQTYFFPDLYRYSYPLFNPNNSYEILYMRSNTLNNSSELWIFNFCSGKAKKLVDHVAYGPSWSSTGWIIYTGLDRQLWKIKENGDSLTQLTNEPGFHNFAKWSPDGSKYAYTFGVERRVSNADGQVLLVNYPIRPFFWINDQILLGFDFNGISGFHTFDITNGQLSPPLHPGILSSGDINFYNKQTNHIYNFNWNGIGFNMDDYWLRLNLNNSTTDTMRMLYDSYMYWQGDYSPQTGKAIVTLDRQHWKDSVQWHIYRRMNLIIMNPNGTGERLIKIPE